MIPRVLIDLSGLRFGDVPGVDPAHPFALGVHGEHDLRGLLPIHLEKDLQHLDDKFHRGIVVIDEYNLVQRRLFEPGLLQQRLLATVIAMIVIDAGQARGRQARPGPPRAAFNVNNEPRHRRHGRQYGRGCSQGSTVRRLSWIDYRRFKRV